MPRLDGTRDVAASGRQGTRGRTNVNAAGAAGASYRAQRTPIP
jgi:hypothetical protein